MDPVTSLFNLMTALANLVSVAMQGQTPEQRKVIWDWYIEDVKVWRSFIKINP